jgi:phage tail protein X
MAEFQRYISNAGDRWDLIADRAYGDITKMKELQEANPDIARYASFPNGITIILPIIPEKSTQNALLPPWKRGASDSEEAVNYLITPKSGATATKKTGQGADLETAEFDYFLDAPHYLKDGTGSESQIKGNLQRC